ncbi:TPA: hypothetical protein ACTEKZ_000618 [Streptococcus agalactiae]
MIMSGQRATSTIQSDINIFHHIEAICISKSNSIGLPAIQNHLGQLIQREGLGLFFSITYSKAPT